MRTKENSAPCYQAYPFKSFFIRMAYMLSCRSICSGNNECVCMHVAVSRHSLWSGTRPWPGRSSRWTLLPPAWISSIARVCVMPWVASPLISTIWSPTCGVDIIRSYCTCYKAKIFSDFFSFSVCIFCSFQVRTGVFLNCGEPLVSSLGAGELKVSGRAGRHTCWMRLMPVFSKRQEVGCCSLAC